MKKKSLLFILPIALGAANLFSCASTTTMTKLKVNLYNTTFEVGSTFDKSWVKNVEVTYSDNSVREFRTGYSIDPISYTFTNDDIATGKTFTFSFYELKEDVTVKVNKRVESISFDIDYGDGKTDFEVGDTITEDNVTVHAKYSDNTEGDLSYGYYVAPGLPLTITKKDKDEGLNLRVEYKDLQVSKKVNIIDPEYTQYLTFTYSTDDELISVSKKSDSTTIFPANLNIPAKVNGAYISHSKDVEITTDLYYFVDTIASSGFTGDENLTNLTFDSNSTVKIIGSNAFKGCINLEKVEIPKNCVYIESGAFSGCTSFISEGELTFKDDTTKWIVTNTTPEYQSLLSPDDDDRVTKITNENYEFYKNTIKCNGVTSYKKDTTFTLNDLNIDPKVTIDNIWIETGNENVAYNSETKTFTADKVGECKIFLYSSTTYKVGYATITVTAA